MHGGSPATARAEVASEIFRKTTTEKPRCCNPREYPHDDRRVGCFACDVTAGVERQQLAAATGEKTFELSKDLRLAEKMVDGVGLYLNPPGHAIVLRVDEKGQIQALDRTKKGLPIHPGRLGHDYALQRLQATWHDHAVCGLARGRGFTIQSCISRHRRQASNAE